MGLFAALKKSLSFSFAELEGARPLSPSEARGLALGAPYAAEGYLPINALTMEADAKTAAKLLSQAWDVHGADDVAGAYAFLLSGGHDPYYQLIGSEGFASGGRGARQAAQEALGRIERSAAERGLDVGLATSWWNGWSFATQMGVMAELPSTLPSSIVAWDTARVVHLSRLLIDAGFTTETEAFAAIDQAVEQSRAAYSSWQGFGEGFITGRAFWTARDTKNPMDEKALTAFNDAITKLHSTEGSPWLTQPW